MYRGPLKCDQKYFELLSAVFDAIAMCVIHVYVYINTHLYI